MVLNQALYTRVMGLLEDKIKSGEYPVGSRIPSERELSELYGVSRITIRQALLGLERQNLLVRRQGKGTFVAHPRIESSLLGYFKFSKALHVQGLLISTKVIEQEVEVAPPDVAEELELGPREKVLRLVRIRVVEGDPFALETTYLPLSRLPGVETIKLNSRSLYEVLETEFAVHPARARETLRPVRLTKAQADVLEVEPDCALLISRTTSDVSGAPFEVARALISGERCSLLVELWSTDTAQPSISVLPTNLKARTTARS
jgi:GntR family transcriptional regulator